MASSIKYCSGYVKTKYVEIGRFTQRGSTGMLCTYHQKKVVFWALMDITASLYLDSCIS